MEPEQHIATLSSRLCGVGFEETGEDLAHEMSSHSPRQSESMLKDMRIKDAKGCAEVKDAKGHFVNQFR